uniref:Methyltransferase-like protein 7A n=1 Tax=Parasteatoda tepidariorum TaxID=114398 RepID=A0A2L2YE28_PARTP
MEVVAYLAVTTLWWISSLTVLSPFVLLLLLSKTFRNGWFSFFFGKVMGPLCSHKFMAKRKKLFELLEEHLPNRDKSIPLDILEIGIGPGANLQFYPENSNLTALDMNPSFFQIFHNNRKKYPQVKLVRTVLNWAEDMNEVEDSAYDVVISTHVLCSVKNIESVMKEVKRRFNLEESFFSWNMLLTLKMKVVILHKDLLLPYGLFIVTGVIQIATQQMQLKMLDLVMFSVMLATHLPYYCLFAHTLSELLLNETKHS